MWFVAVYKPLHFIKDNQLREVMLEMGFLVQLVRLMRQEAQLLLRWTALFVTFICPFPELTKLEVEIPVNLACNAHYGGRTVFKTLLEESHTLHFLFILIVKHVMDAGRRSKNSLTKLKR